MPHGIPPHLVDSLSRPFTPVSPSNLDPITARFQQVTIADVNYFQDTLSGSVTPSASAKNAEHSFFDEEDDRRREVRADAERPFPVDRDILREIVHENMGSPVVYLRFLSSGELFRQRERERACSRVQATMLNATIYSPLRHVPQSVSGAFGRWPRASSSHCSSIHASTQSRI